MRNPLPFILWLAATVGSWFAFTPSVENPANLLWVIGGSIIGGILASSIKVAAQWERSLVFRLGRFSAVKGPGIFFIMPFFDSVRAVDTRIVTLDIPVQQAITKDNVPVSIDGVIFMRVSSPEDAVIQVQNYAHAIRQYAQTALRDVIGAMTLDLMHGEAVENGKQPCAAITSGGTESILSAMLVYREIGRADRGITKPEIILPTTAHPAFEKAAWLFGLQVVRAPVDPTTTQVDVEFVRRSINERTVALIGSAGNYPYGTIDPIEQLSSLATTHKIGLHVDGCLGGFILPFGEQLGYDIPVVDFRLPGVTSISADTHKFGFSLKGSSVVLYRDLSMRRHQYFASEAWPGGKYHSPGIAGSRSVGMLAATWSAMVSLGREGYLRQAKAIFETSYAMQDAVRRHPELRILGKPSFCFAFNSGEFDIYHINDFMKQRGWRFNGQQYPNALHMCVTRPQTQAGVVDTFSADLADAVAYAKLHADDAPASAAIYGGFPGGELPEVMGFIKEALFTLMDSTNDARQTGVMP